MDSKLIKKQIIAAYDKDAKRRKDPKYKRDAWKEEVRDHFIDLLLAEKKRSVLELGSGPGYDSKVFKERGFDVLATDISKGMVSACKAEGLNAKELDVYEINTLPQKYDAIFAMNLFLHIPRVEISEVLKRVAEQLNPDGILFWGTYGGKDEETMVTDPSRANMPVFISFLSDDSVKKIVGEVFDIVEFRVIAVNSEVAGRHFQAVVLRKRS